MLGSRSWLIVVFSASIRACSPLVCRVGSTSSRVALPPPDWRIRRTNARCSSRSTSSPWASSAVPLNCGSLMFSNTSLAEWSRNVVAIWVHSAVYLFMTVVRSPG